MCKVLQHIGADIWEEKIESCHSINKKSDQTIVKSSRRKYVEHMRTDVESQEGFKRFKSN